MAYALFIVGTGSGTNLVTVLPVLASMLLSPRCSPRCPSLRCLGVSLRAEGKKLPGLALVEKVAEGAQMHCAPVVVLPGDILVAIGETQLILGGATVPGVRSFTEVVAVLRQCPRPSQLRFLRPYR